MAMHMAVSVHASMVGQEHIAMISSATMVGRRSTITAYLLAHANLAGRAHIVKHLNATMVDTPGITQPGVTIARVVMGGQASIARISFATTMANQKTTGLSGKAIVHVVPLTPDPIVIVCTCTSMARNVEAPFTHILSVTLILSFLYNYVFMALSL